MIQIHTSGPAAPCIDYHVDDRLADAADAAARAGYELAVGAKAERLAPDRFRLPLIPVGEYARAAACEEDLERIAAVIETTIAIQTRTPRWHRLFGLFTVEDLHAFSRDIAGNAATLLGDMLLPAADSAVAIGRGPR